METVTKRSLTLQRGILLPPSVLFLADNQASLGTTVGLTRCLSQTLVVVLSWRSTKSVVSWIYGNSKPPSSVRKRRSAFPRTLSNKQCSGTRWHSLVLSTVFSLDRLLVIMTNASLAAKAIDGMRSNSRHASAASIVPLNPRARGHVPPLAAPCFPRKQINTSASDGLSPIARAGTPADAAAAGQACATQIAEHPAAARLSGGPPECAAAGSRRGGWSARAAR